MFFSKINIFKKNLFINTWHIHKPNGMLYYCIEYLRDLKSEKQLIILVRNKVNKSQIISNLENKKIKIYILSTLDYFIWILYLFVGTYIMNYEIFTPSPHPLPFINNQNIVIHDSYSFIRKNMINFLKYYLLKFCLLFSKTNIIYINNQDSYSFSKRISRFFLIEKKINLFYIPNKIRKINGLERFRNCKKNYFCIGLSGSDSEKKNYESFIKELSKFKIKNLEIIIFGFKNKYTIELEKISPYKIKIIDSSKNKINIFLENINCIVNVSKEEGFCRPIAYANSASIPLLTIDTPVMREFYDNKSSIFFKSVKELANYIFILRSEEKRIE